MESIQKTPYSSAALDEQVSRKHPKQRSDADREILRSHNERLPFMEDCNKIYVEGRRVLQEALTKSETRHQPAKDNSIGPRRVSRETIYHICGRASELQPFQSPPPLSNPISEARKLVDERLKPKRNHASAPLTFKPTNPPILCNRMEDHDDVDAPAIQIQDHELSHFQDIDDEYGYAHEFVELPLDAEEIEEAHSKVRPTKHNYYELLRTHGYTAVIDAAYAESKEAETPTRRKGGQIPTTKST